MSTVAKVCPPRRGSEAPVNALLILSSSSLKVVEAPWLELLKVRLDPGAPGNVL